MLRPTREMIVRDLEEALLQVLEPQIDTQNDNNNSNKNLMRTAIQRFVQEETNSFNMAELADALDSLEQTAALFLEYLRAKGIAGDPVSVR